MRTFLSAILALAVLCGCPAAFAADVPAGTPIISAGTKMLAPPWALKERQLLDLNSQLIEMSAKAYTWPDGSVNNTYNTDGQHVLPHGVFTMMHKWPLIYALGGDDQIKDIWWHIWCGGIQQMTKAGFNKNEFLTCHDGNHMGQGYEGFFLTGLAMPDDPEYKRQVLKFASFYDGTNKDVQNYDLVHKTMKSIVSGGAGPVLNQAMFNPDVTNFWTPDGNYTFEGPTSLIYTCLGTEAFLLTGEEHYRKTVVDYINAWRDRCEKNGGVVPTKVNCDGTPASDWWGGILGWDKPTARFGGLLVVMSGPNAAWSNGLLLTGDTTYYDQFRKLADFLWLHRYIDEEGKVVTVPGWMDGAGPYGDSWESRHSGPYASILANLYAATMSKEDLGRVNERSMLNGPTGYSDWWEGGYEPDWFSYLQGKNPDWPRTILDDRIKRITPEVEALRKPAEAGPDKDKPGIPGGGWCGPLVNLMTGAVEPRWQGQLLLARFLYFDPERKRPGITTDCAALVEAMTGDSATLVLVNTNATQDHTVLVQGGAYGEHQLLSVTPDGNSPVKINGAMFAVNLPAGTGQRMVVSMKRYANTPRLKSPWPK